MDFVNEKDVTGFDFAQDSRQITRFLDGRAIDDLDFPA